jgi:DNA-binding transcriptional ArsR family regulator
VIKLQLRRKTCSDMLEPPQDVGMENRRGITLEKQKSFVNLLDEAPNAAASRCCILSQPMRLKILKCLMDGEKEIDQLVQELDARQTDVRRHLRILLAAGFVGRSARGSQVYYRIADPLVLELCNLIFGKMAAEFLDKAHQRRSNVDGQSRTWQVVRAGK